MWSEHKRLSEFQEIIDKTGHGRNWSARCEFPGNDWAHLRVSPPPSFVEYGHVNQLWNARIKVFSLNIYEEKKENRKMDDGYKVIILYLFITSASAFCPDNCICDDDNLETTCIETNLEVNISIDYLNIV